jgi:murein DD-endopeptidase MepM/ murein hydrolase activator NlpD
MGWKPFPSLFAAPLLLLLVTLLSGCGGNGSREGFYFDPTVAQDGAPASQIRWDLLEIVFPVVGKTRFSNDWQAPRSGNRKHAGTDLLAKKMSPVVAVADGEVVWVRAKKGKSCCYLSVRHDSQGLAFESRYVHLNNDTPGTDDGKGIGIAKGIKKGTRVLAGQLLGWVGDSGNAESTSPHLHFELRDEYGRPINPFPLLSRAARLEKVRHGETKPLTAKSYRLLTAEEQDDLAELEATNSTSAKLDEIY